MKILLGDLNAKVGREDIFKPTTGNDGSNVPLILIVFGIVIVCRE
jgi:hypothetical protein